MNSIAYKLKNFIHILFLFIALGCSESAHESTATSTSETKYLYVSSGVCYSGPNTTFSNTTASNQVYRINLSTGTKDLNIADYWMAPSSTGDSPVSIQSIDSQYLYVLVENTSTTSLRRIEKINKIFSSGRTTFSNNVTALNAQLRDFTLNSAKDLLISKSTAIEYITSGNSRIGAPFISASAAPCNTSTTLITRTISLSNGNVIFLHSAAGQNRIGIFSSTGGTTCLAGQSAPNANSYPTAAVYDSANTRLIVAYAGNAITTDLNSIYTYSIDESTGAISNPQKIYDVSLYPGTYPYLLYGISEMTLDNQTNTLYVATANNTTTTISNYNIEKFTYNPSQVGVDNTKVLTRSSGSSFYSYGNDTKCISKMIIAN